MAAKITTAIVVIKKNRLFQFIFVSSSLFEIRQAAYLASQRRAALYHRARERVLARAPYSESLTALFG
jgi:hypothetical protein